MSNNTLLLVVGLVVGSAPCVLAQDSFEERFFASCPRQPRIRVHRDASPFDAHAVLYTTASLMELEAIRLTDWLIDLPLPGAEVRPLERTVNGIRAAYHRLGEGLVVVRFGELVDALQLRELSLGDAATTYTVATGGVVSPGTGTVVRVNRLLDWIQHTLGDLDGLGGRLVGRPRGLIGWRLPGRLLDGLQGIFTKTVHSLNVAVARTLERSVEGLEGSIEGLLNVSRPIVHRDTTVFLRMPTGVYRAHELWVLKHRARIYVGTAEELTRLSHADLFHPHKFRFAKLINRAHPGFWALERFGVEPAHVYLVTDRRTFAKAPTDLLPYVIPAAWVLQEST